MEHDQGAHLVRMVNQIATNLSHERDAATRVRVHLEKFWARSMKQRLIACLDDPGHKLTPLAHEAVKHLAGREAEKSHASSSAHQ
ncbi:formate dehydrogenase subunit delta [Halomonas cupida]|uniref:Formate dehydrogenase subunit delta n=1 Tax=Halomonas cupida TaxID=44933 RepID=A0A1M7DQT6_9GAMM|nr:formate dehydrogenase subunit delta [Halomonas cupida]GEN23019.1 hypothetical protein HCU01_09680 [Halomonas cupida]SHL81846.1 formate dehydrogenase subunit delta [Halomonas cupida]